MIQLLHKAEHYSNKFIGIRKFVLFPKDYKDGDTVLFTNEIEGITVNIDLIITNSMELFEKYKNNKNVLYFKQQIEAIEENAIVKIDKDMLYFSCKQHIQKVPGKKDSTKIVRYVGLYRGK